jgi:hypothetical protein
MSPPPLRVLATQIHILLLSAAHALAQAKLLYCSILYSDFFWKTLLPLPKTASLSLLTGKEHVNREAQHKPNFRNSESRHFKYEGLYPQAQGWD